MYLYPSYPIDSLNLDQALYNRTEVTELFITLQKAQDETTKNTYYNEIVLYSFDCKSIHQFVCNQHAIVVTELA